MDKKYTEKQFLNLRDQFLSKLDNIQQNHKKWFDANLPYYKGGGRPTLRDMTNVYYDADIIKVLINIKDIPREIMMEIKSTQDKFFKNKS